MFFFQINPISFTENNFLVNFFVIFPLSFSLYRGGQNSFMKFYWLFYKAEWAMISTFYLSSAENLPAWDKDWSDK